MYILNIKNNIKQGKDLYYVFIVIMLICLYPLMAN